MGKKVWTMPRAELTQFAANEYVAACTESTLIHVIDRKDNNLVFIDNGDNSFKFGKSDVVEEVITGMQGLGGLLGALGNIAGAFVDTSTSFTHSMGSNSLSEFNDVVSGANGFKYDQAVDGLGAYWLSTPTDNQWIDFTGNLDDMNSGYYAWAEVGNSTTGSATAVPYIWYDTSAGGYWVGDKLGAQSRNS